jgi:hypothetical protein
MAGRGTRVPDPSHPQLAEAGFRTWQCGRVRNGPAPEMGVAMGIRLLIAVGDIRMCRR